MAVSRRLRFEILRRDGHTCRYCGAKAPDVPLTVDHVVPVTLGGGDEPNNLVTACTACNAGKSSVPADAPLVEDVDATALLFAKGVERAAELRRQDMLGVAEAVDRFLDEWCLRFPGKYGAPLPDDAETSVERFFAAGLDADDVAHLVVITSRKFPNGGWGAFKYFCGCCWREITERQELARRLIEDGDV